ncbi:ABC transporter substrate-binding protein [Paenibacillus hodogayensis]|uniref:ABC transporter substrate-binding protein n=1 Tax=Paenibacillus hodogayensis TaxID=279208 RepID=A0ABV5VZV5_9BACL
MPNIIKRGVVLAAAASLALMSACSNGGTGTGADSSGKTPNASPGAVSSPKKENIELTVAWWGAQARHDLTIKVIDLFQKKYPHIKINTQYSAYDGYMDKLNVQFSAGNAPDVIQYGGSLPEFVSRGVVLPLDPYVGKIFHIENIDKSMVDAAKFDGKLYGISLGSNARTIVVNNTLLQKYGLSVPPNNWTWDDVKKLGIQFAAASNGAYLLKGFDFDLNGFEYFVNQRGKFLHKNGLIGFDKQDVMDWFVLFDDLRKNKVIPPSDFQTAEPKEIENSYLVKQKYAMALISSNQLEASQVVMKDQLSLHDLPHNAQGSGVPLRPSMFMAGYAKTKHPEEVAAFLDFMVNDPEATKILGSERGIPVSSKVRDQLKTSLNPTDKLVYEYVEYIGGSSKAPYTPDLPGVSESTKLFQVTSDKIGFKQLTLEKAVDELWTELEKIMKKYAK